MIEPTSKDIGRYVAYTDNAPVPTVEAGRITSFNDRIVFVAFPKQRIVSEAVVQGCDRGSLVWLDELLPLSAECQRLREENQRLSTALAQETRISRDYQQQRDEWMARARQQAAYADVSVALEDERMGRR